MNESETRMIWKALLTREVECRLLDLLSTGAVAGTIHTCVGQELVGAAVSEALVEGDSAVSNHRGHGHFLSITGDLAGLVGEVLGKASGVCGGRGGSQHLRKGSFFSSGVLGGLVPVAAGLSMAHKLRGDGKICVAFLGDGALGEGVVYETFNLASVLALPLLFVVENNGYAQSTATARTTAGSVTARAQAFSIPYDVADTWSWRELARKAHELAGRVRSGGGPSLLEVGTYRLKAHSKGDDTRPREEVESYEGRDPLNQLMATKDPVLKRMLERARSEVDQAVASASSEPDPLPSAVQMPAAPPVRWARAGVVGKARWVGQAINEAFRELLSKDERVLLIGEDLESPYGGAFKVTQDLSTLFPGRVMNMPISEAAMVGMGTGLALGGYRPFVEVMFGDFLGLAFDQIFNQLAKLGPHADGGAAANVTIRTPMGGGRGYGPTHSQTLDRHFLGIPGLRVVALSRLHDPGGILGALGRADGPTLLLENKLDYSLPPLRELPAGFVALYTEEDFPTALVEPQALDIDATLIGYGGMAGLLVEAAERLFVEHDLICQVLAPSRIHPFRVAPFMPSISRAHEVLVVEEGQIFGGFGAEIVAQLAELGFEASCHRIGPAEDCTIPASRALEREALPTVENVVRRVAHRARSEKGALRALR